MVAVENTPKITAIPTKMAISMFRMAEPRSKVCDLVQSRADDLEVELIREFDESGGALEADPQALRSLLVNLIENSLDACRLDKKQPEHRVTVRVGGTGDSVLITISDDGIGMSGVAVYRSLKTGEATKSIPIIVVTGVSDDFKEFISSRRQVPAPEGYISKPVDHEELLKTVEALLP